MKQIETFDPSFFEQLKKAEERHFWFQVRRRWISDKISKFAPPPAKVLEIGCGTGNVSSFLAEKGIFGYELRILPRSYKPFLERFLKGSGRCEQPSL